MSAVAVQPTRGRSSCPYYPVLVLFAFAGYGCAAGTVHTSTQPVVIYQTSPEFPPGTEDASIKGRVLVDFIVDKEGNTRQIFVAGSTNAALEEVSRRCVAQWRFKPGTVDGVPVYSHMEVPIEFDVKAKPAAAPHPAVPQSAAVGAGALVKSTGPCVDIAFTDVKPRPLHMERPVYPPALRKAGVEGMALTDFIVDASGIPTQVRIIRATNEAFAASALDAISQWVFTPAMKDGAVVPCHEQIPIVFSINN